MSIRAAASRGTLHVACAGAGGVRYLRAEGKKVDTATFVGACCDLCLDGAAPVLFLAQRERVTGLRTARYRIVVVRRVGR